MSGSYDRYRGRPPASNAVPGDQPAYSHDPHHIASRDAYGAVTPTAVRQTTGPSRQPTMDAPAHALGAQAAPQHDTVDETMYAPSRDVDKGRKMKTTSPVVPPASVTGRSLTLVIAIMCFLASLTAGAVWMIKDSSDAWQRDIASEVTVQVESQPNTDIEQTIAKVIGVLAAQPGIRSARPLSLEVSSELLEPWLGSSDALKTLPVPRLIAIELDRNQPPNLDAISKTLETEFQGVSLDDHRRWQQQIQAVTRSFALGGIAILALVAAATMAIIVSATKSAMSSNREIVEVLHFVGATDKFIAREFEKHFLRVGIKAGIVGALLAALVFLGMPAILAFLGGGAISAVEMQRLIGSGALDATGYGMLGIVVFTIAVLCMITSRIGVKRILQGRH